MTTLETIFFVVLPINLLVLYIAFKAGLKFYNAEFVRLHVNIYRLKQRSRLKHKELKLKDEMYSQEIASYYEDKKLQITAHSKYPIRYAQFGQTTVITVGKHDISFDNVKGIEFVYVASNNRTEEVQNLIQPHEFREVYVFPGKHYIHGAFYHAFLAIGCKYGSTCLLWGNLNDGTVKINQDK